MSFPPLSLHPLVPDRLDDFLRFFDHDAFADNPRWASCYCQCFHEDPRTVDWHALTRSENRASACRRSARGTMRGWLAYADGRVVGWCNAGPRPLLHALDAEGPLPDADAIGSIACFVVAPGWRRRGVARALLDAAVDGFERDGLAIAEAYPRPDAEGEAANHQGPLALFVAAGFAVVRVDEADGGLVVRKPLR